jgi:hypothetical protein
MVFEKINEKVGIEADAFMFGGRPRREASTMSGALASDNQAARRRATPPEDRRSKFIRLLV